MNVPERGWPDIWVLPIEGLDPGAVAKSDLETFEAITNDLAANLAPNEIDLSRAGMFVEKVDELDGHPSRSIQKTTFAEVSKFLSQCKYVKTQIVDLAKSQKGRLAFASSYQCPKGLTKSPYSMLSLVLDSGVVKLVFLHADGAMPVVERDKVG